MSKSSLSSTNSVRGDRNIMLHPIDTRFQSLMPSPKLGDYEAANNRYGRHSVLIHDNSPLEEQENCKKLYDFSKTKGNMLQKIG